MFKSGDKIVDKSFDFCVFTFDRYFQNKQSSISFFTYEDEYNHYISNCMKISEYRKLKLEKINNVKTR